jgi:hypothetical protein
MPSNATNLGTASDTEMSHSRFSKSLQDVSANLDAADADRLGAQVDAMSHSVSATIDFSKARNLTLTDADIERYIDPRITGNVRQRAHQILSDMAPAERRNFFFIETQDGTDYAVSNTWEDLQATSAEIWYPKGAGTFQKQSGEQRYDARADSIGKQI